MFILRPSCRVHALGRQPQEYIAQSLILVQKCMLSIQVWMNQNMLKLNPSKTVELLNQNFDEIDSIRNLGVAFDQAFSFKKHVSNICRSAFYHIRDLRRIRIHLNKATAISLANALVSSRLDYCNSLLFVSSEKYKTSLQRVQNCFSPGSDQVK